MSDTPVPLERAAEMALSLIPEAFMVGLLVAIDFVDDEIALATLANEDAVGFMTLDF